MKGSRRERSLEDGAGWNEEIPPPDTPRRAAPSAGAAATPGKEGGQEWADRDRLGALKAVGHALRECGEDELARSNALQLIRYAWWP